MGAPVPILPELPYGLPDGSVVDAVEDLEVGLMRVVSHMDVHARARDRTWYQYRLVATELTL